MIHDEQSEKAILGCILIDNNLIADAMSILNKDDFYVTKHKEIYAIMIDMYSKGESIDITTLASNIKDKQIDLTELVNSVGTTECLDTYIKYVKEKSMIRQINLNCIKASEIQDIENPAEFVNTLAQKLFEVTNTKQTRRIRSVSEIIPEIITRAEKLSSGEIQDTTIKTGFVSIDRIIGGFEKSNLITIGARPGVGKSSFVMNLAMNIALQDKRILIFSLEMTDEEMALKTLTATTGLSGRNIHKGLITKKEWIPLGIQADKASKLKIDILDSGGITTAEIRAKLLQFTNKQQVDIVIIDHLHCFDMSHSESRYQAISRITRELKLLCKEFDLPIVLLAQLNREIDKRGKKSVPNMSDLRDSGSIEADSDVIFLLHNEEETNEQFNNSDISEIKIIIEKNRHGKKGYAVLDFIKSCTLFKEKTI